jgi:serine/threonine protein kinase
MRSKSGKCVQANCAGAESWDQTMQECEIMMRKLHPCIMPLIDYKGVQDPHGDGGHIYMLMPFYRSGSLWDLVHARLSHKRQLSATEILSILSQVFWMTLDFHLEHD